MAHIYFKLVLAEKRTIESVPENLRAEVQALLAAHYATEAN